MNSEDLCVHSLSVSAIPAINRGLNATLAKFAHRPLEEAYPYLIIDARWEKVHDLGVIRSKPVLIAVEITWECHRQPRCTNVVQSEFFARYAFV